MMNRLTMVLCVCAVVFAVAALAQSVRLWGAQGEAEALRTAAATAQKDAHKAPVAGKHAVGTGNDNWNPAAGGTMRGKGGDGAADAKSETAGGSAATAGGKTALSPAAESAKGGSKDKGSAVTAKDAKAAGSAAAKTPGTPASPEAVAHSQELARSAQESIKTGNLNEAATKLQQSVQENPKNSDAWRNLASVDRQLGKFEDELATYQNWITEQPEEKIARYMAAEAYARNGIDDQALQYLSDFQQMSTDNPQSYAMTAGIYQQLNMPAEQGAALQQWVAAAPTSPDARRVLGDFYQRAGQGDQAIAEYQAMAQLQPNTATPYVQMGNAYSQMGQLDAAAAQFQTAVSVRPNDVEAITRLADVQRQAGDMQSAVSNYQRVVSLEPGSGSGVQAARNIQYIQEQLAAQAQQGTPKKP